MRVCQEMGAQPRSEFQLKWPCCRKSEYAQSAYSGCAQSEHGCLLAHGVMFDLGLPEVHCLLSAWKTVLVSTERVAHWPYVIMQAAPPAKPAFPIAFAECCGVSHVGWVM